VGSTPAGRRSEAGLALTELAAGRVRSKADRAGINRGVAAAELGQKSLDNKLASTLNRA
jgi:hypothetical protein